MSGNPIRRPNGRFAGSTPGFQEIWVPGGRTRDVPPDLIEDTSHEEERLRARYNMFRMVKENSAPSAKTRIQVEKLANEISEVMQVKDLSDQVASDPARRWHGQEVAQVLGYELPGHTGHTATGAVEWSTQLMQWIALPQCVVLKKNGTRFRPEFQPVAASADASEALNHLVPHLSRVKAQELVLLDDLKRLLDKHATELAVMKCGLPRIARHGLPDARSLVVFDGNADGDEPVKPSVRRAQVEMRFDGVYVATIFDFPNYTLPSWFYGPEGKRVQFLIPEPVDTQEHETFTGAALFVAEGADIRS